MQILKDEIRKRILSAAMEEFMEKGFPGASMRSIADRSFIRVSNLYNYFRGKEDLFNALADPVFGKFNSFMKDFLKREPEPDFKNNEFVSGFAQLLLEELGVFLIENRRGMILLFDKSGDTRHENLREKVIGMLEEHFIGASGVGHSKSRSGAGGGHFVMHIIATNLLEGIMEILRHGQSEKRMKDSLASLIHYHVRGFAFLAV